MIVQAHHIVIDGVFEMGLIDTILEHIVILPMIQQNLTHWSRCNDTTKHLIKTELGLPSIVDSYHMVQMRKPEAFRRHSHKAIEAIHQKVQQVDGVNTLHPIHHCKGDLKSIQ